MSNISVNVCGLKLKNPVIAAAGPPTRNSDMIKRCAKGGAGAVVSKTVSTKAARIPKPCMKYIDGIFFNTELWSELTPEHWIESEYEKAANCGVPLIIGLGYTEDQISDLIPRVDKFADAYEISVHYVGRDISSVLSQLRKAKSLTEKPVFMKISPGIIDIAEFAIELQQNGADAIAAINSVGPSLSIDIETGIPRMGSENGYGWMTGTAIKPIALRYVYEVCRTVNIPVFAVGGISNGRDAIEMIMAGATGVQVCTEAILNGENVFGKIAGEINNWLDCHGYNSLDEIRGITIKKMDKRKSAIYDGTYPDIDIKKCIGCGKCSLSCKYEAILIEDKKAVLNKKRCFKCGLCSTRCPLNAIHYI